VLQAALMVFILDTAIGVGVWIPFTLGKSAALLSVSIQHCPLPKCRLKAITQLDPHRTLQLLHLPIRAIRIVTDPVVDFVLYLIVDLLLPSAFRIVSNLTHLAFAVGLFAVGVILGKETQERTSSAVVGMVRAYLHK
jgi:E3 ubiquitin-protein ligase MARCH6